MSDSLNEDFTVTSDKADYQPGDTAVFTASNIDAGATVEFEVAHVNTGADGIYGTEDDLYTYDLLGTGVTWSVTDGGEGDLDGEANGTVTTSWLVNWDALNQTFMLYATDTSTGDTATAAFTDAPPEDVPPDPEVQTINNAIFTATGTNGTGTGVFPAFVQLQDDNDDDAIEEGFNTDAAPVLDTKASAVHNHAIQLGDIPLVNIAGQDYLEFRLDINEPGTGQDITLEALQLYWDTASDLTALPAPAQMLYDLDGDGETSVTLVDWKSGSGQSDYVVRIPVDLTGRAATDYIYLYSLISGIDEGPGGGFEEWSFEPPEDDGGGGNDPLFSVFGTKYEDMNGNGAQDAGDNPLSGWAIYIYSDDDGNGVLSAADGTTFFSFTTTDGLGDYEFGPLDAGDYIIVEGNRDGWIESPDADTTLVNLLDSNKGENGYLVTISELSDDIEDRDFANFDLIDLSGIKYTDEDGDGTGDTAGTPGQTFTITLYVWTDADGEDDVDDGELVELDTTETDADDGTWSFTGLGPLDAGEKYVVREIGEDGWTQTFGNDGYIVDPTSGNDTATLDFANFENISLSGTKYTDVAGDDNNTSIDADDTAGTPGQTFTINLYSWIDDDGEDDVDASELTLLDSTETDETTGNWSFGDLGPLAAGASYYVAEEGESGWTQTFGNDGYIIDPTSGDDVGDLDFANFENYEISGYKWEDADAQGDWDAGEEGIENWTIYLDEDTDPTNGVVATATTDSDGKYVFTDVGPGTYYVYEANQTNWFNTYNGATTITGQSGLDHAGDEGVAELLNFGNFFFEADLRALTKGFWGQHFEAWNGKIQTNKQGVIDTKNLYDSGVLDAYDVLPDSLDCTPTVDWNGDGVTNAKDSGILLGDVNGNGIADGGENTLWVSLTAAQQIIKSSDSSNDTRQILMSQALASQLNIYNGVNEPLDLVGEAVAWLKGQAPYTYSDGSSGKVDTDSDGILETTEYSTTSKSFLFDANGAKSGTALTSNLQAWQKYVDVSSVDVWNSNMEANGEGLKNALMWFNQTQLVTDVTGTHVGWLSGGVISDVNFNTLDKFWLTLHDAVGGGGGIA